MGAPLSPVYLDFPSILRPTEDALTMLAAGALRLDEHLTRNFVRLYTLGLGHLTSSRQQDPAAEALAAALTASEDLRVDVQPVIGPTPGLNPLPLRPDLSICGGSPKHRRLQLIVEVKLDAPLDEREDLQTNRYAQAWDARDQDEAEVRQLGVLTRDSLVRRDNGMTAEWIERFPATIHVRAARADVTWLKLEVLVIDAARRRLDCGDSAEARVLAGVATDLAAHTRPSPGAAGPNREPEATTFRRLDELAHDLRPSSLRPLLGQALGATLQALDDELTDDDLFAALGGDDRQLMRLRLGISEERRARADVKVKFGRRVTNVERREIEILQWLADDVDALWSERQRRISATARVTKAPN